MLTQPARWSLEPLCKHCFVSERRLPWFKVRTLIILVTSHWIASSSAWLPLLYDTVVLALTTYRTGVIRHKQVGKIKLTLFEEGILYYRWGAFRIASARWKTDFLQRDILCYTCTYYYDTYYPPIGAKYSRPVSSMLQCRSVCSALTHIFVRLELL